MKNEQFTAQKWNGIFFLVIILSLISIPSILVFLDRWLDIPGIKYYPHVLDCEKSFLCKIGYPGYFFWIIVFLLISALVFFVFGNSFSSSISSLIRKTEIVQNDTHYKFNKLLLISIILLVFEVLLNLYIKRIPGAELIPIIMLFYIYFLNEEEASIFQKIIHFKKEMFLYLKKNFQIVITVVSSPLILSLFIMDYNNSFGRPKWIYYILLFTSLIAVIKQSKKLPVIYWLFLFIIVIYSFQINNWMYTAIGDEFSFYEYAKYLSTESFIWKLTNFFNIKGVYDSHTILSSIITYILMRFLGFDHQGWIFSNYIIILLSLLFFYGFLRKFFNKQISNYSIILLSASSYLISFSRIGYNNLQALLFGMLLFFAAGVCYKKRTLSNAYLFGISTGLLLYTFQASYFYIPVVFLFFIVFIPPKSKENLTLYFVSIFGFLLLFYPFVLQPSFIDFLKQGSFYNQSFLQNSSVTLQSHFQATFFYSIFSYLYLRKESHYVVISMIDLLSAIFFFLGLLISIKKIFTEKILFFLVFAYFLTITSSGMIHDYFNPPITRLFITLPWICCFAAIGMLTISQYIISNKILSSHHLKFINLFLILLIAFLNFFQSTKMVQKTYNYFYFEPIIFKVLQFNSKHPINNIGKTYNYLILTPADDYHLLYYLQNIYKVPDSISQLNIINVNSEGIPKEWEEVLRTDENLIVFSPNSFSQVIFNQISREMEEKDKIICELKYRKEEDAIAFMWVSPEKQYICSKLFSY